ncbi:MAG: hypothetical protein WAV90_11630 [Gordonia amarae]
MENLIDGLFRNPPMPDEVRKPARDLIQGLLVVSNMVLRRAGLTRGTPPGVTPRTPMHIPGANGLRRLEQATFISNAELDAYGSWLRTVVDTFALDPGELTEPCTDDITDDRLYVSPFLRLDDGYRVILPLDLALTIRFHLLSLAQKSGQLNEIGQRWRDSTFRRLMNLIPSKVAVTCIEENRTMTRYIAEIDSKRHLHIAVATDPLTDWDHDVWGSYDTRETLAQLEVFSTPAVRTTYSNAEELVHLILNDSPGRSAFWGTPNINGSDPMLIGRADDIEVILHQEPDGLLGLLLFGQAVDRRPGWSISTDILDEFSSYIDHDKSFYLSDDYTPTGVMFETGDGLIPALKLYEETDRHGVVIPAPDRPIVQVSRRYPRDAPEIYFTEPSSPYLGCVIELSGHVVFVTIDPDDDLPVVALEILDTIVFWIWECAQKLGTALAAPTTEIIIHFGSPSSWQRHGNWSRSRPALITTEHPTGHSLELSETFIALLHDDANTAERELVRTLLETVFKISSGDLADTIDRIAPLGPKRMVHVAGPR